MKTINLFALAFVTGLAPLAAQTIYAPGGAVGASSTANVGIGTSSPTRHLSIYAQYAEFVLKSSASSAGAGGSTLYFGNSSADDAGWLNYDHANNLLTVRVNSGERLRIDSSGNVGIGTISPSFRLHAKATGGSSIAMAAETDQTEAYLSFKASGTSTLSSVRVGVLGENLLFLTNGAVERARIDGSGNVGIGTTAPGKKLDVAGTIRAYTDAFGGRVTFGNGNATELVAGQAADGSAALSFNLWNNTAYNSTLFLKGSGNVGIGTANPTHTLSVNGTIRAKEIIVDNTGWADYVFADDYRLVPLSEVESHIRAKKHLPGIPSAAEVAKEGVNMGDMQARLLAKVEELTLHAIEQHKMLKTQQGEIASLRAELARLSTPN